MGIADVIEEFILRRLSSGADNVIILRRNEMAEEIACAPSQISYVLSTRFTIERGFNVESRRGSGGFVRIARVDQHSRNYQVLSNQVADDISYEQALIIVDNMIIRGLINSRETFLIRNFIALIYEMAEPPNQAKMLRALLLTLAKMS